jgi:hypothetical protein
MASTESEHATAAAKLPNQLPVQGGAVTPEAEGELHFDTPVWVRPGPVEHVEVHIPQQARGGHDIVRPRPHNVPDEARWVARHRMRTFCGILLLASLVTLGAGTWYVVRQDSLELLPYLGVPLIVALGMWAVMLATTPAVMTLKNSIFEVKQRGHVDTFDLADPGTIVQMSSPTDPKWHVEIDRIDGSTLSLSARQIDPEVIRPVFEHYRRIAQDQLAIRLTRYNM